VTTNWTNASALLHDAQRIVIVTHVAPDGDAIGTLLGLAHMLRAAGKSVDAAVDGGVPDYLAFLPGTDTVHKSLPEAQWDLYISVDASDEARTGECGAYARSHSNATINLDHHVTNTGFADVQLVVSTAVSAAEVAFDWIAALGLTPTQESAQCLLCGMVTDTLGFRTSNVTPRTLEIAQQLMQLGASLTLVTSLTLDTRDFNSLLVWREALAGLTLDGGVIYTSVPFSVFSRLGVDPATELNLSGFMVKVNEAMVSAVFKERHDGRIELSFRAKLGFNVGALALELGGGGHVQASGATIDGPLDRAVERVVPLLKHVVTSGTLVIK
jgi:phosphoesterase RecJ-like protein